MDHVVAFLPKHFDDEFADKGIVLNDKYTHWGTPLDDPISDANLELLNV
jgi:hypothetical protein